jgi:hypothetical protein
MKYKNTPHTDLSRNVDFQSELNNISYERMLKKAAKHELEYGFTNKKFSYFLGLFSSDSKEYTTQMVHFWNWLKKQVDVKREYTYIDCAEVITETLILKGIRIDNNGRILTIMKTKTGKRQWLSNIFSSPFFSHYEKRNKEAGRWIRR